MENEFNNSLNKALKTSFIDMEYLSDKTYQTKFILNNQEKEKKILSYLTNRIEKCKNFWISAAFLTMSGVSCLRTKFDIFAEDKNKKGKIYFSDYQYFTEPKALKKITEFNNIETRLYTHKKYHGKGYMFEFESYYDLLIGSANLTSNALSINDELNIHFRASKNSLIVKNFKDIFNKNFNSSVILNEGNLNIYTEAYNQKNINKISIQQDNEISVDYDNTTQNSENLETIDNAENIDNEEDNQLRINEDNIEWNNTIVPNSNNNASNPLFKKENKKIFLKPNLLQVEALKQLQIIRDNNFDKALVISATATGKTLLSALDAKAFKAKKLLFIVHRYNIAKKAKDTFKIIFKDTKMGMYSSKLKEKECDFIFSTVQTITRTEHLNKFTKDYFDYIIIDETHRSGAETYKKILDYFTPKFLLGMTATPERTDGFDIFKQFNYQIACEIRLHRAMKESLVCPFHYFGVSDIEINGEIIGDSSDFNRLIQKERVKHIHNKLKDYSTDTGIVRGLVFCSRKDEAKHLSDEFNKLGEFKTTYLFGDNSEQERENAINRLENEDKKLDYIFTVDIFNEGINIPSLNQIVMVRPTQSAIIFVQQLGRGLRKSEKKDYLTVIDFIGNYKNNFQIPIALYGDKSFDKDNIRKFLKSGSDSLPGSSTVNFDKVALESIYTSLNNKNLQTKKDLQDDYLLIKQRIGTPPMMMDFVKFQSRDPIQFIDYEGSMYSFSKSIEGDEFHIEMSKENQTLLKYFSKLINNKKRGLDSFILYELLNKNEQKIENIIHNYKSITDIDIDTNELMAAIRCLNFSFHKEVDNNNKNILIKELFDYDVITINSNTLGIGNTLRAALNEASFKKYLLDSTVYSLYSYKEKLIKYEYVQGFLRYEKYTREDVFRILNWKETPRPMLNVGGYKVSEDSNNCPLFVTYKKSEDISETTKYEDKFISFDKFSWMSKSNRKIDSNELTPIINQKNSKIRIPLFIKKSDDEGDEHYFIGNLSLLRESVKQTFIKKEGKDIPIVNMHFLIDKKVDEKIYDYITS